MKVSIVIPTYNRSGLLLGLLHSIRNGAHRPVQCVVVDDASTDQTTATVHDFSKSVAGDAGLTISYRRIPKKGAQVARNEGIRMAQGEAIIFVDSDDELAPEGLRRLVEALEAHPESDYSHGIVQIVDESLSPLTPAQDVGAPYNIHNAVDLMGYHWHTMGALYRRECVERIGFWNEELKCSQDWEYQIRAKLFGGRSRFVDTVVGYWRQHAQERIGGKEFRDDYAASTEPLFRSIHESAKRANRNTHAFEVLLAKRLVRHAIYCGANARPRMKRRMLAMASSLAGANALLNVSARCFGYTPAFLDRLVLGALNHAKSVDLGN
jgi:glycosyltransferase involved in cell wall biosynthesis